MITASEVPDELLSSMQPWKQGKVKASRSLSKMAVRIFRKGGSVETVGNYIKDVSRFCEWLELAPDEALAKIHDWPKVVDDYLDFYVVKQGNAKTSSRTITAAVRKWLETNEILSSRDLAWQRVDIPKYIRSETDQIPTKQEIRAALSGGKARDRALILTAVSSGLRRGSLLGLRWGDIDLGRETPLIRPRPETTKGRKRFFTFCTPEAKGALEVYRREREMRGETVGKDSYIFTTERPRGRPYMSGITAAAQWVALLRKAGIDEKGNKHSKMHFHVLRKFFSTWAKLSGVNSDVVEYFEGHRATLPQVYFIGDAENVPEEAIKRLEAEYAKAVPALTVMSDEDKIRSLESQVEEQGRKLAEAQKMLEAVLPGFKEDLAAFIVARRAELTKSAADTTHPSGQK